MIATPISADDLLRALHDALGRVHEFDELADKLHVFGLQPDGMHDVVKQRWQDYRDNHEDSAEGHIVFVQGFVEGLLTGLQLGLPHAR